MRLSNKMEEMVMDRKIWTKKHFFKRISASAHERLTTIMGSGQAQLENQTKLLAHSFQIVSNSQWRTLFPERRKTSEPYRFPRPERNIHKELSGLGELKKMLQAVEFGETQASRIYVTQYGRGRCSIERTLEICTGHPQIPGCTQHCKLTKWVSTKLEK